MSAAFTPGPWKLRPHAKLGGTQMYWVNDVTSVGTQVEPDARLIAAAPRLYDLVKESLYHLRMDDGAEAYHKRVLAVLAEIGGEQ